MNFTVFVNFTRNSFHVNSCTAKFLYTCIISGCWSWCSFGSQLLFNTIRIRDWVCTTRGSDGCYRRKRNTSYTLQGTFARTFSFLWNIMVAERPCYFSYNLNLCIFFINSHTFILYSHICFKSNIFKIWFKSCEILSYCIIYIMINF